MATSCYFGFGRKPGLNGNSIYFTTAEDFNDSNATMGQVKQMDKGSMLDPTKDVTSQSMGDTTIKSDDYSKVNITDSSNTFIPILGINYTDGIGRKPIIRDEITEGKEKNLTKQNIVSMYATPTLNNSRGIIDGNWQIDDDGVDKFKYKQQMNNVTTMEGNVPKIMPYQEAQALSAESAYISMPNLYNCINFKSQKYYYNIRPPIIEKYVIEEAKTDDELTDDKISEAKKSYKKMQKSQQFSSQDEYTYGNISDTCTACNFDITTIDSEYAFNVEEYGNVNEEFLQSNESNKTESKDEISAKDEKFPESYTSKAESDAEKYTTSTMIASEKQYIQSYYNANDLSEWKVY